MSSANWEKHYRVCFLGLRQVLKPEQSLCARVCVCVHVWVREEYNTIQLLLGLSTHCVQPITACDMYEIHSFSLCTLCEQVKKESALAEELIPN